MNKVIEQLDTLPITDNDPDLIERQTIQHNEKKATYLDNVVNSYNTKLSEKRQKILAWKDNIRENEQDVDKRNHDKNLYSIERNEIKALEEETKHLQSKLETIRKNRELAKQRIDDQEKASAVLNKKLDTYKKLTRWVYLDIKDNVFKFDFTHIDKHQPDKIFSFTLNLTEDMIFIVEECDPMIPNLDTLTKDLNEHDDPFLFTKLIRREFCALVSSTSSSASSSPKPSSQSPPAKPSSPPPKSSSSSSSSPSPSPSPNNIMISNSIDTQ